VLDHGEAFKKFVAKHVDDISAPWLEGAKPPEKWRTSLAKWCCECTVIYTARGVEIGAVCTKCGSHYVRA
jgi:hypothetical protein